MILIPFSPEYATYVRERLFGQGGELFAARFNTEVVTPIVEARQLMWKMYYHLWHNQGLQKLHPVNQR